VAKSYADPRGRHVRVYVEELMDSPAYRALSPSAVKLFFDLRANLGKTNNGDLMASMMGRPHKGLSLYERGWRSATTLASALYELRSAGFLVQTRAGGVESGSKTCALYGFTDVDIFEQPKLGLVYQKATHAYRVHATTVEAAADAIRSGMFTLHAAAVAKKDRAKAAKALREKTTLQKLERDASEIGAMSNADAPDSGAESPQTLQILEQEKRGANQAATRMDKRSEPESAFASEVAPSAPETGVLCITATHSKASGPYTTAQLLDGLRRRGKPEATARAGGPKAAGPEENGSAPAASVAQSCDCLALQVLKQLQAPMAAKEHKP
jgi:hypothetical protein